MLPEPSIAIPVEETPSLVYPLAPERNVPASDISMRLYGLEPLPNQTLSEPSIAIVYGALTPLPLYPGGETGEPLLFSSGMTLAELANHALPELSIATSRGELKPPPV